MKREEKITKTYLKSIGFEDIVFEPNGNRTPDFALDNKIAVEVRRLNQFHKDTPIEGVKYNVIPQIIKQLESFENENYSNSAFVGIRYSRPIKFNKILKEKIKAVLETHSTKMSSDKCYVISDNLQLDIFPSTEKLESKFNFGLSIDLDEGGFVLGNVYESLKIIIKEKTDKIEQFKFDYDIWWLALVDNIGNGLSENEIVQLRKSIDFELNFDKVIVISNLNPTNGKEI